MTSRLTKLIVLSAFATQPVLAQTLVPATSEDLMDFDRRVSEQLKKSGDQKNQDNFGSQVREEAKKLKESGAKGNDFGKWVSGERKKADAGRPSTAGGGGNSIGPSQSAGHGNSGAKGPPDGKGRKK